MSDQPHFVNPENMKVPREWDAVSLSDYILDEYKIEVHKKGGIVRVRITGEGSDGGKRGIAFEVNKDTPYAVTAHHMRACFVALFRHEIQKALNRQDATEKQD